MIKLAAGGSMPLNVPLASSTAAGAVQPSERELASHQPLLLLVLGIQLQVQLCCVGAVVLSSPSGVAPCGARFGSVLYSLPATPRGDVTGCDVSARDAVWNPATRNPSRGDTPAAHAALPCRHGRSLSRHLHYKLARPVALDAGRMFALAPTITLKPGTARKTAKLTSSLQAFAWQLPED